MAYQPQSIDTSEASDRYFFQLLRQRSASQRLQMAAAMIQSARRFSLASLQRTFSHLTPTAFAQKVALAWLQDDCPVNFLPTLSAVTWIQDSITLAGVLHRILTPLAIPYYITGGVAAIAYGEPRTTRDLDLIIAIAPRDLDRLVTALETAGFYAPGVDEVRSGQMTSLGITHMETIARADLVLARDSDFDRSKWARLRVLDVPDIGPLNFISPEDIILNKLLWGQRSQSEKQWRDVLGVLKVQHDNLEFDYLRQWGTTLGIRELLETAITAAS